MKNLIKHTIAACVMSLCLMSVLGIKTYAEEAENQISEEQGSNAAVADTLEAEFVDSLEELEAKQPVTQNIEELKPSNTFGGEISKSPSVEIQKDDVPLFDFSKEQGARSSVTQAFTDVIETQGDLKFVNITLRPGDIVQTNLICPQNEALDYDLYLYEYNADGTLGNMVDYSNTVTYFNQYSDGSKKTLDEAISYINTGTENKNYAIIIMATTGGSATDMFTLIVSCDEAGNYDAAEPNDSPYHAYETTDGALSGAALNVINDQDWFVWNVPADFKSARIKTDAYDVEVYTSNGVSMILQQQSGGVYQLKPGYYYIRVFNNADGFKAGNYTLSIDPVSVVPAKIKIYLDGDMGSNLISYPQGRYFRFDEQITANVLVTSATGFPVSGVSATMDWVSGPWTEQSGNKYRTSEPGYTNSVGQATLTLSGIPIAIGEYTYDWGEAQPRRHYYDLDMIYVTTSSGITDGQRVYHFAYSIPG